MWIRSKSVGERNSTLDLSLEHTAVSAFRRQGQLVNGQLKLTNQSAEALDLRLDLATSDYR